ncbi:hypothetical protein EIP91_005272 [Steccherinum ochraceum]|uniref:Uncharacterized protein n=1 Tax=Steccherinum ochraceum TaxID=92696 RepID=A0A4R0RMM2_9APHY|nr:hypothetical protein EIP91_005272 [Steccherinum ochraceum]
MPLIKRNTQPIGTGKTTNPPNTIFTDIQSALHRIRRHPSLTQHNVFSFLLPFYLFAAIVAFSAVVLRTSQAPSTTPRILATWVVGGLGAVGAGVVILRMVVWAVAKVAGVIANLDFEKDRRKPQPDGSGGESVSTGSLLGGIFM